ncbi:hypothetical protein BGW37DRAFT_522134 [Umbelopsis sp. PMI_123]|nr:hypothetical protein BGW37DRAFT_522134 [Umbelopsis sp. PMI_123]
MADPSWPCTLHGAEAFSTIPVPSEDIRMPDPATAQTEIIMAMFINQRARSLRVARYRLGDNVVAWLNTFNRQASVHGLDNVVRCRYIGEYLPLKISNWLASAIDGIDWSAAQKLLKDTVVFGEVHSIGWEAVAGTFDDMFPSTNIFIMFFEWLPTGEVMNHWNIAAAFLVFITDNRWHIQAKALYDANHYLFGKIIAFQLDEDSSGPVYNGLLLHGTTPVLPASLHDEVFNFLHDIPFSGHLGFHRTLQRVQHLYWFSQLRAFVSRKAKLVPIANKSKPPDVLSVKRLVTLDPSTHNFDTIAIDTFGPITVSDQGNKYILVVHACSLSSWS